MGRKLVLVSGGLLAVALTVALLAAAAIAANSTPASNCASGHPSGNAAGFNTLVPSGNAGENAYVEKVPTARGGCPSAAITSATRAAMIPPSTQRALLTRGSVGIATEALARATGPGGSTPSASGLPGAVSNGKARVDTTSTGSGGDSSPVGAIADALDGSSGGDGLGALLPVILILCVLGIGGGFLLHRRLVN